MGLLVTNGGVRSRVTASISTIIEAVAYGLTIKAKCYVDFFGGVSSLRSVRPLHCQEHCCHPSRYLQPSPRIPGADRQHVEGMAASVEALRTLESATQAQPDQTSLKRLK